MRFLCTAVLSLFSIAAMPSFSAGDAQAGRTAYASCSVCHGSNAEGSAALSAPRLTHLEPVYIVAQLQKFKAGIRGGPGSSISAMQMAGMAATLPSEQAIQDVAAYIDTLEAPASLPTLAGDAIVGADYFNQFCGACHGAVAQGITALNSPRLAGGDDWYLAAQIDAFRAGIRGTHAQDRMGKQMRAMAGLLPDNKTVADVVVFIRGITP